MEQSGQLFKTPGMDIGALLTLHPHEEEGEVITTAKDGACEKKGHVKKYRSSVSTVT